MRVALIGPASPTRGGIAAHHAGLAAALEARGHRVRIFSYLRQYPRTLYPGTSEVVDGAPQHGERILDTLAPRSWLRLRRLLRDGAFDALVVQWWHPITTPVVLAATGCVPATPVVLFCHNVVPHEWFPLARLLTRTVLRRADTVICHSQAVADAVRALVHRDPIVAPMPLLVDRHGAGSARSIADEASPIEFLLAGVLRPYKGVDVLVEAWRRARLPGGARLTIAGESFLGRRARYALERAVADDVRIRLVDRWLGDDELTSLLARADVVVFPYRSASQSALLPLALAAGAHIVATDAGGLAEPLATDARADRHRVVRANDSVALARALEEIAAAVEEERSRSDAARQTSDDRVYSERGRAWRLLAEICERAAGGAGPID